MFEHDTSQINKASTYYAVYQYLKDIDSQKYSIRPDQSPDQLLLIHVITISILLTKRRLSLLAIPTAMSIPELQNVDIVTDHLEGAPQREPFFLQDQRIVVRYPMSSAR